MKVTVISINSSPERRMEKTPIVKGDFLKDHGLAGDGHSGNWHRQVSIFSTVSLNKLSSNERIACEESFSENITVSDIELYTLPIGTQLKIGEVTFEITQIGKPFERNPSEHTPREIIMHQEGVFAVVLSSGSIEVGDELNIIGTP